MAEARIQIILSDGRKAGETLKELGKDANRLNKELKDLKPGTEQFVAKSKDLQQVNARLKEVKDQITGTTQASNALKNVFDQYVPFSGQFAEIGRQIGGVKSGVGGLTSGFGLLKGAIAATGIGLLIVLLGSLWSWFSKTERGADFLSKAMAAAGAAVNVLIDRASKLIDALIAFVQGDWSEAADKFGEATRGVTEEMVRETKAAWELADALDQLEELEGKLILLRSRTKQQVSELRLLSKDESKSFAERSAALETAIELTRQLNQQELEAKQGRVLQALQVKDLAALQKQYGVTLDELRAKGENLLTVDNLGMGESTQEDLNAAFQAIADYNEAIAASNDAERTLVMDLNTLKKKARREDSKDQKEELAAQKKALEEHYKAEDNIRKLEGEKRQALIEDEKTREIEALNIATEEKILALQGSEAQILEQIKLLRDIQGAELAAIDRKWAEKKAEEDKKAADKKLQDALAQHDLDMEVDQNLINERYLTNQITERQFRELSTQNLLSHEQQKLAVIKAAHGEQSAEYQRAYGQFLTMQKNAADASVEVTNKLAQDQMAALQGGLQIFGNVFGAMAGQYEEGTKRWKTMAIAQAMISAMQGAINAYSSTAAIPVIGPGLAPIAAGLALAAGYANVEKIKKTEVKSPVKKELGGYLSGPRHSEGGIPIEAEGGEFIFSRKAVRAIGVSRLNAINNYHTRKFAIGGPVNPFDMNRAAISSGRASSSRLNDINSNNQDLIARIDMLIEAQDRRIDRLKTYVLTSEIEDGMKTVTKIKEDADL